MATRTVLIGVLAGTAMLAGCASTSRGEPAPAKDTSAATPANYGAPAVEIPLDATVYFSDPCAVLDRAQLAELRVAEPGTANTEGAVATIIGPQCTWHAVPGANSSVDVGFVTGAEGLGTLYANRAELKYFEETTVQDYPAVFTSRVDNRAEGTCNINVGITDSLTFRAAELGFQNARDACDRAKQVADAVLTTLKGAT